MIFRCLIAAILACACLSAQTPVPVTFIWDLDPTHDTATFELQANGVATPCPVVTTTERRCSASFVSGTYTFRLRAINGVGAGPWSEIVTSIPLLNQTPGTPTILQAFLNQQGTGLTSVARDTQNTANNASANQLTISLTVANVANRVAFGALHTFTMGANPTATFNGVSMTRIYLDAGTSPTFYPLAVFFLLAPAVGTFNMVLNTGGAAAAVVGGGVIFNGVDQATPYDTPTIENETAITDASIAVASATGDHAFDIALVNAAVTVGSGQTQFWNDTVVAALAIMRASDEAGAASVTMNWTHGSNFNALHWAANLNAASTGIAARAVIVPPNQAIVRAGRY